MESKTKIQHIILVLSGKGGVGKSMVASELALEFLAKGKKVGLLDIDLCGPSIPRTLGLSGKDVKKSSQGWIPVYTDQSQQLAVMSIGFLLGDPDAPVVWRAMVKSFLEDVVWGNIDYLVIDTPPGTSDEHISIIENLKSYNPDGAVIVTTPQVSFIFVADNLQGVSLSDVKKEISFCKKVGIQILGVVENMSGFICPHCQECTNIFSSEGGKIISEELNLPFLGKIPIDPLLMKTLDDGTDFRKTYPDSQTLKAIQNFVDNVISSENKKTSN